MNNIPLSLYIHFPWCIQKCPYCDFNSHVLKEGLSEKDYIDVLLNDLQQDLIFFDKKRPIQTIFMGGGTPSLFSPDSINDLLVGIRQLVAIDSEAEITLEANPSTFESSKFMGFKEAGINRLSIGVQSFNDEQLQRLGRVHSAKEAIMAIEIAHHIGFDNFNIDLMFGLPSSDKKTSINDIKTAMALKPKHLSFYQLTLEPNTYFYRYPPKLPDSDSIFEMQQLCQQLLAQAGYQQYEVSAYSQGGFQCQHNLNYWEFGDYLGIGAGAHGKISTLSTNKVERYWKPKNPESYLKAVLQKKSLSSVNRVTSSELPLEFLMNGLRLKNGFSENDYIQRTGLNIAGLEKGLKDCLEKALIIKQSKRFYCSPQGWNFLDAILEKFIV